MLTYGVSPVLHRPDDKTKCPTLWNGDTGHGRKRKISIIYDKRRRKLSAWAGHGRQLTYSFSHFNVWFMSAPLSLFESNSAFSTNWYVSHIHPCLVFSDAGSGYGQWTNWMKRSGQEMLGSQIIAIYCIHIALNIIYIYIFSWPIWNFCWRENIWSK